MEVDMKDSPSAKQKIQIPHEDWKHKIDFGEDKFPSPGEIQGCRVALVSDPSPNLRCFFANKNQMFYVEAELTEICGANDVKQLHSFKQTSLPTSHTNEIVSIKYQTLDGDSSRLGSIDAAGYTDISIFQNADLSEKQQSFTIPPIKSSESGWTGLDFNPQNKSQLMVASMFDKRVTVYDQDRLVYNLHTPQYPTQISYVNIKSANEPLIAVTEYNQLTVWDIRSNNPCIKRVAPSPAALYAIASVEDYIGVAGAARSVSIVDCRKWTQSGNWANCLKYEVTSLHFSTGSSNLCYVGGMDSTVACGEWRGNYSGSRYSSILGDSRWIGLHKAHKTDNFVGLTELGNLYVFKFDLKDFKPSK